jgi:hypothetical protein
MKRPKTSVKKMTVKTETIRPLDGKKLANVAGAVWVPAPASTSVRPTAH